MPESVETPDTSDTQVDGAAADQGDEEAPLTPSSLPILTNEDVEDESREQHCAAVAGSARSNVSSSSFSPGRVPR